MKVNKNDPYYPTTEVNWHNENIRSGAIPIRLEIASRILAATYANPNELFNLPAVNALNAADALIDAHNLTCEEDTRE